MPDPITVTPDTIPASAGGTYAFPHVVLFRSILDKDTGKQSILAQVAKYRVVDGAPEWSPRESEMMIVPDVAATLADPDYAELIPLAVAANAAVLAVVVKYGQLTGKF